MNYVTVGVDLGATYRRGPVFRGTCLVGTAKKARVSEHGGIRAARNAILNFGQGQKEL